MNTEMDNSKKSSKLKGIPGMKWGLRNNYSVDGASDNAVNHPAHYTQGDIECIDAIKSSMSDDEWRGYLKGNVQKYVWRFAKKDNPIQDLEKAQWYLKKLLEEIKND